MDWPLLDVLSDAERRDLLMLARRRKFKKNDIIFHEGDPSDTLHLVAGPCRNPDPYASRCCGDGAGPSSG